MGASNFINTFFIQSFDASFTSSKNIWKVFFVLSFGLIANLIEPVMLKILSSSNNHVEGEDGSLNMAHANDTCVSLLGFVVAGFCMGFGTQVRYMKIDAWSNLKICNMVSKNAHFNVAYLAFLYDTLSGSRSGFLHPFLVSSVAKSRLHNR